MGGDRRKLNLWFLPCLIDHIHVIPLASRMVDSRDKPTKYLFSSLASLLLLQLVARDRHLPNCWNPRVFTPQPPQTPDTPGPPISDNPLTAILEPTRNHEHHRPLPRPKAHHPGHSESGPNHSARLHPLQPLLRLAIRTPLALPLLNPTRMVRAMQPGLRVDDCAGRAFPRVDQA
jgi:hypothetical protein